MGSAFLIRTRGDSNPVEAKAAADASVEVITLKLDGRRMTTVPRDLKDHAKFVH
jgi:hypothetical protein